MMKTVSPSSYFWLSCLLALSVSLNSTFAQNIVYVNIQATGSNNGSSWASAFVHLQSALIYACNNAPAEVWVASGTYYPDEGTNQVPYSRESSFNLCNGVAVLGGFPATGNPGMGQRDPYVHETILSGDLMQNDGELVLGPSLVSAPSRSDNAYTVVLASQVQNTAILDGFIIESGNATHQSGSPFSAPRAGGGLVINGGSPQIRHCVVRFNSSVATGGGVLVTGNATPLIDHCRIESNFTVGDGGGIYNNSAVFDLVNTKIRGNRAATNGGGMYNNFNASPRISGCVISGNMALAGGGMFNVSSSSPVIVNCTFTGNLATSAGGALNNMSNSNPQIVNCIIYRNMALGSTDGLFASIYNHMSNSTVSYSIIQHAWSGGGLTWDLQAGTDLGNNKDVDPHFEVLLNPANAPDVSGDFRLLETSPAINAGKPDIDGLFLHTHDIAGTPRVAGDTIDMGAYEYPLNVSVFNPVREQTLLLTLFPNPTRQYLGIEALENIELIIVTISGQVLRKLSVDYGYVSMDVSDLIPGYYFIHAYNADGQVQSVPLIISER